MFSPLPGECDHCGSGGAGAGGRPPERPAGATSGDHGGFLDLHRGLADHGLRQGQVRPPGGPGRRWCRHWWVHGCLCCCSVSPPRPSSSSSSLLPLHDVVLVLRVDACLRFPPLIWLVLFWSSYHEHFSVCLHLSVFLSARVCDCPSPQSLHLSVSLSVFAIVRGPSLCICLSLCQCLWLSVSPVFASVSVRVCDCLCLFICLSLSVFVIVCVPSLFICLPLCPCLWLSVSPVSLSVCLSVRVCDCLCPQSLHLAISLAMFVIVCVPSLFIRPSARVCSVPPRLCICLCV